MPKLSMSDPGAMLDAEAERLEGQADVLRKQAAEIRDLAEKARQVLGAVVDIAAVHGGGRVPKAAASAPAALAGKAREAKCKECKKTFTVAGRGRMPSQCPGCRDKVVKKK